MSFKRLTDTLSVSPQLSAAGVAQAAACGYKSIIDNRPDGEETGQPTALEIAALAASHGMAFVHIPVVAGSIGDADIAAMTEALGDLATPILGYCRTGARAAMLWALSNAGKVDPDTLLKATADAGYDLAAIRPRLTASA